MTTVTVIMTIVITGMTPENETATVTVTVTVTTDVHHDLGPTDSNS